MFKIPDENPLDVTDLLKIVHELVCDIRKPSYDTICNCFLTNLTKIIFHGATANFNIAWKYRIACIVVKWHSWNWNWPDWRNNWHRNRLNHRTLRRAHRFHNAIPASGVVYLCYCSVSSHRSSLGLAGRPLIRPVSKILRHMIQNSLCK